MSFDDTMNEYARKLFLKQALPSDPRSEIAEHVQKVQATAPLHYPTDTPEWRVSPHVTDGMLRRWTAEMVDSHPDALSVLIECMRPSAQDTLAALERRGWAVVRRG